MSDQRKRDDYTKDRFEWLDQVAADPELPASAFKVAYAIATSLWRNKGTVTLVSPQAGAADDVREAWIGTREIADKIAMSRFTVMTMVDRLKERGHLEVDPGKQGRGHANHYRLVRKGAPANLLERKQAKLKGAHTSLLDGAQAKPKAKPKGAPANLLDGEKVSRQTSRGALAHLNAFVPSVKIPSEAARGAPQARLTTDSPESSSLSNTESLKSPMVTITGESGVAVAPPPDHLQRAVEHKSKRTEQQGLVIDQHGNPFAPPPERRSKRKSNRERGLESLGGGQ